LLQAFRVRAIFKALNCTNDYFNSILIREAKDIYFRNVASLPHYKITCELFVKLRILPSVMDEAAQDEFSLSNRVLFSRPLVSLISQGYTNIGSTRAAFARAFRAQELRLRRKLVTESAHARVRLENLKFALVTTSDHSAVELARPAPIFSMRVPISKENDYKIIFLHSGFSCDIVTRMSMTHWRRLHKVRLPAHVKDVIWRFWHGGILTYKGAKAMGLKSNGSCPYCSDAHARAQHIVECVSTKVLWDEVCKVLNKGGLVNDGDVIHGDSKSPLINTIIYCATYALYNRFMCFVNSGGTRYNLVSKFKQNLFEFIYRDFLKKDSGFMSFWNDGRGLFRIYGNKIDIRL